MGGVGKTTLLSLINNKFGEEVNEFDVVIWIVVSKDLQNGSIQDNILGRLRNDKEWKGETEKEKASSIYNILSRKKKFVLLLDDVWSKVDLNKIGVPPLTQDNGSKIVFTTRSKEVCKDMKADDELKVDCLSSDDAWELFRKIVGECHEDILTPARKIAEKCYGLPLALSVIGNAMACNNHGHDIIGSLVRAHLLMVVDGEFRTGMVKMHDVIREMALWIGSNLGEREKNLVKSGAQLHYISKAIKWEGVRRISLMNNQIKEIFCCPPECPNLSTLLLRNNNLRRISGEFFQSMPALVVLDLSWNKGLRKLPEEICCLTSLQYLSLSATWIESLPMKGLRKLISLDLEDISTLESIDGIGTSLPNLQVLKLFGSRVFIDARLMEELQLLEHLTILTATVQDALILESIQGIKRLASCVQRLRISEMSAQFVMLNTVALGNLRELDICYSEISEIKIEWESRDKEELLCPTSPCFKHLSTVNIGLLIGPKDLTWLLLVPNLRDLTVMRSSSIEEIINREKGMSISNLHPDICVPFQKLEVLRLSYLRGLKRICSNPLPNLRQFLVDNCPKLPKSATEFTSASGSNDMTINQVREGYEYEILSSL